MEFDKEDITLEALIISAGLWLLQNPHKKVADFDPEYLTYLKLNLETTYAEMQGSIH